VNAQTSGKPQAPMGLIAEQLFCGESLTLAQGRGKELIQLGRFSYKTFRYD
jgi:hypothetical protein